MAMSSNSKNRLFYLVLSVSLHIHLLLLPNFSLQLKNVSVFSHFLNFPQLLYISLRVELLLLRPCLWEWICTFCFLFWSIQSLDPSLVMFDDFRDVGMNRDQNFGRSIPTSLSLSLSLSLYIYIYIYILVNLMFAPEQWYNCNVSPNLQNWVLSSLSSNNKHFIPTVRL